MKQHTTPIIINNTNFQKLEKEEIAEKAKVEAEENEGSN